MSRAARLRKRAFRAQDGKFLAEGPQAVREALATTGAVVEVFATDEAGERHPELVAAAKSAGAEWLRASAPVLAHLADTVNPQGVVAVCRTPGTSLAAAVGEAPRLVTILAHVRDPGNAGTVIRVSDAAGADGVVFSRASVDPFNAKCVRATAGSMFHLPVAVEVELTEAIAAVRDRGLVVRGADGAAGDRLDRMTSEELARPTAWVFGNEAWGLPPQIRDLCDDVVAVPLYGAAESLNLSTAAAVCLYATAQAQHRGLD